MAETLTKVERGLNPVAMMIFNPLRKKKMPELGFETSGLKSCMLVIVLCKTHYQTTNFRLFQTESLQRTISNLMKMAGSYPNGKKTLGKGEIAGYEQFLLFPQCFH